MIERFLDISEQAVYINVEDECLKLSRQRTTLAKIPLREVAALSIGHPGCTITTAALSGLAEAGGIMVITDRNCLPTGMIMPLSGHTTQTERMRVQSEVTRPLKKRLWQQIVRCKIREQTSLLEKLGKNHGKLGAMGGKVRSGDPDNLEAQAARFYFVELFGKGWRRDRDERDENRHLNYGYTVLRAIVARAVCASGLHPSLGLHHHNRYDPFCLADDLMEPFRPLVDEVVYSFTRQIDCFAPLTADVKQRLVGGLLETRLLLAGESRGLFDVVSRLAASLAKAYDGKGKKLTLPERIIQPSGNN